MSADEATSVDDADVEVDGDRRHAEVVRGGQRVIVVNSQPKPGAVDMPPRRMRRLGAVQQHATDPVTGETRRRSPRTGSALSAIVLTAVPVLLAAFGITFLEDRTLVLAATGALALLWLLGLASAWRGLGPKGRDGRGAVMFGRAVGLVAGAVGAVSLLNDKVAGLL